eukprot:6476188-Amphidinium_carterae.1
MFAWTVNANCKSEPLAILLKALALTLGHAQCSLFAFAWVRFSPISLKKQAPHADTGATLPEAIFPGLLAKQKTGRKPTAIYADSQATRHVMLVNGQCPAPYGRVRRPACQFYHARARYI